MAWVGVILGLMAVASAALVAILAHQKTHQVTACRQACHARQQQLLRDDARSVAGLVARLRQPAARPNEVVQKYLEQRAEAAIPTRHPHPGLWDRDDLRQAHQSQLGAELDQIARRMTIRLTLGALAIVSLFGIGGATLYHFQSAPIGQLSGSVPASAATPSTDSGPTGAPSDGWLSPPADPISPVAPTSNASPDAGPTTTADAPAT